MQYNEPGVFMMFEENAEELTTHMRSLGFESVGAQPWGQEEDRRKSRDAGFNHHMVKPVNLDALGELLAVRQLH